MITFLTHSPETQLTTRVVFGAKARTLPATAGLRGASQAVVAACGRGLEGLGSFGSRAIALVVKAAPVARAETQNQARLHLVRKEPSFTALLLFAHSESQVHQVVKAHVLSHELARAQVAATAGATHFCFSRRAFEG